MTRRRWLQPAELVRGLRARLRLTQAELAERLGVSTRTIIRGEQRGLELPWRSEARGGLYAKWAALQKEAIALPLDPSLYVTSRAIARKVSRPKKRLRLSRDLLRERKRR